MSALPNINDNGIESRIIEPSVPQQPNGKHNHNDMAGPRREPPALRQDNLTDAMAVLVQSMAEEREERREQRAITQALVAKLANGNGASKTRTIIQTVVAVVGLSVGIIVYIVTITSSNRDLVKDVQGLQTDKQKLEHTVERLNEKFSNLEKLYMIEFGRDPDAAGNKPQQQQKR
jgi:hypothetical protein